MAVHDTATNDRTKYTAKTLESLQETVDFKKHRLIVIDNNSCEETKAVLHHYKAEGVIHQLITLNENIGTSRALNMALRQRNPGELTIKMDNDVTVHNPGWLDIMEDYIQTYPHIGILGLKRDDVYGELIPDTTDPNILYNADIMGTCTAFNPLMLDKVGLSMQPSPHYGGDDVLMSARSLAAGFRNAYIKDISITHLDDGQNAYCEWKRAEAAVYLSEMSVMADLIKKGELSYFYGGD